MTLLSLISCAVAPEVVAVPDVIKVPTNVYIPVPEELTRKGELAFPDRQEIEAMTGKDRLIHTTALLHWNTARAMQCYVQLDLIGGLAGD